MKKLVNVLLYSLLLVVVMAGMMGIRYFIVQEEERVELEAEKRLEAERNAAMEDMADSSQSENIYMVLVKQLPVYKNKKIVKIKADSDADILSYGDKVTVLSESRSYAQIQTEAGTAGYVWGDCIGALSDKDKQANAQPGGNVQKDEKPEVVVIDVSKPEQRQETQEESSWQDAWVWSLETAKKTEKKLEEKGYTAVMVNGEEGDTVSTAKSTELANQIKADAVIHICIGSSGEPADSGAAVYCCTSGSSGPAAKYYTDSRKLAKHVLKYYTKATGFDNAGIMESDEYMGIQRSKRPMILFKIGNLSNEEENRKMSKSRFQSKMARGITDGIDAYFRKR